MALPIVIPAIAKGAAALSSALGLTTLAGLKVDSDNITLDTSEMKNAFIQQNMPLIIASMAAKAKMQQPTINIPAAENALVLKPEYRTVTMPTEFIGYKPLFNNEDTVVVDDEYSIDIGTVSEQQASTTSPNNEKPKNDNKSKDKKGFKKGLQKGWEYTKKVGNIGLQGIGIGLGLSPIVGVPAGVYYGGKALGWWGEDSNNSSNEIDREGTEQAWEDMKVGRKPGQ